ncbi:hypothetical protein Tco_1547729 [Tanacetum coccineum]
MDNRPPMLVESDYDSWKIRIHRNIQGKPLGKLIWNSIQNGPSPHLMKIQCKEIWDNVEMLMQGSGRTLQQRKEDLFDEFERFRAIGNEPIHDYFVRFHKLVNDMKITQLEIPTLSMNTQKQFPLTNNQLWSSSNSRILTRVHDGHKLFVKPFSEGSRECWKTQERRHKLCNVTTATGEEDMSPYFKALQSFPTYGRLMEFLTNCKEPKRAKDSQYFKDKMLLMEAKEKGATLDAEAEAFLANVECTAPYYQPLAMTTTNIFEVNHEDAYDSDVDEGPNAAAAFMANLSSTNGNNHHVNKVHPNAIQINDSVNYQLSHEMHHEEQSDSDVESELDDNTTPSSTRTASIRKSDTSVLEDLKALSWKTCQEGSLLNLSDHSKYEHVGPKFSEWRIEEKITSNSRKSEIKMKLSNLVIQVSKIEFLQKHKCKTSDEPQRQRANML